MDSLGTPGLPPFALAGTDAQGVIRAYHDYLLTVQQKLPSIPCRCAVAAHTSRGTSQVVAAEGLEEDGWFLRQLAEKIVQVNANLVVVSMVQFDRACRLDVTSVVVDRRDESAYVCATTMRDDGTQLSVTLPGGGGGNLGRYLIARYGRLLDKGGRLY